ncbi:hypothetical protein F4819DRAFT_372786 [Hypoxylon fuscum]|nr:hypothetical protein F4819DRAFT_372786 [Hypoxylon fuscum]
MNASIFNHSLTFKRDDKCGPGLDWYDCGDLFRGCCNVPACDLGNCPLDIISTTASTSTSTPTTDNGDDTTMPLPPPTDSSTTFTTSTISSTASTTGGSATGTGATTPSPQSAWSFNPTNPTSTLAPPRSAGESAPISMSAIVGMCVGGTAVAMFVLYIAGLVVRRRLLARRMALISPKTNYADDAYAREFMNDHPGCRGLVGARPEAKELEA